MNRKHHATKIRKVDATEDNGFFATKCTSKYPNKKGYYRTGVGNTVFVTNLAANEHLPGKKESVYHTSKGNAELFAKNIWRKFYKSSRYITDGIMRLNEALVFQKAEVNPIAGLILLPQNLAQETTTELLNILKANNSLKLFLYDPKAQEHIVRYLDKKNPALGGFHDIVFQFPH